MNSCRNKCAPTMTWTLVTYEHLWTSSPQFLLHTTTIVFIRAIIAVWKAVAARELVDAWAIFAGKLLIIASRPDRGAFKHIEKWVSKWGVVSNPRRQSGWSCLTQCCVQQGHVLPETWCLCGSTAESCAMLKCVLLVQTEYGHCAVHTEIKGVTCMNTQN